MDLPAVGTRISLSGSLGTIKFSGEVENAKGVWLGVEWDDASRGKHSGTKDGKHYFHCRIPNAGSFIRPSASIHYGRSFLNALSSKYIEAQHGTASQEKVILGSSNGIIEVEVVGLDKIRGKFARLECLREISLDFETVACTDPTGEIRKTCPNVRGLDLSSNLLPSWDIVALMTAELPMLERLALNRNRLAPPHDTSGFASAFSAVTELQLNGTLMSWPETESITLAMPNLQSLEVGYNMMQQLPASQDAIRSQIKLINLDGNELGDWAHIFETFKRYTKLERLILTSNWIDTIPPVAEHSAILSGLKHLACSFNNISAWTSIDSLSRWCPALEILSFNGNPLTEASNARQFLIAKIPSLLTLDASRISSRERTDCELFYLSHIVRSGPTSDEERRREHPRWDELCAKHGRPEDAIQLGQDKLIDRLILLNVHTCDTWISSRDVTPIASKSVGLKILPTMSLRTFRLKVFKTVKSADQKVTNTSVELWLKMRDGKVAGMDHDHDAQDLGWWGLQNGSDIYAYLGTKNER